MIYKAVFFKEYLPEFFQEIGQAIADGISIEIGKDFVCENAFHVTASYCGKAICTVQKNAAGTLYYCVDGKIRKTVRGLTEYAKRTREPIEYAKISK